MFIKFFEVLREKGLRVTLGEWLTFQEALGSPLRQLPDPVLLHGPDDTGEERDGF